MDSYEDYVRMRCRRNPSLQNLLDFLLNRKVNDSSCRIIALDHYLGYQRPVSRGEIALNDVVHEFEGIVEQNNNTTRLQGRILLFEDLSPAVLELLGRELSIDPLFFSLHLHTAERNGMQYPSSDQVTLPSRLLSQDYVNFVYHKSRVVHDPRVLQMRRFLRDIGVERKLVFMPSSNIGFAQHCVSILRTQCRSGQWLAILLVDPPMRDGYLHVQRGQTFYKKVYFRTEPFLGQYEDFIDHKDIIGSLDCPYFDHDKSMVDDLVHYWTSSRTLEHDWEDPSLMSLAYHPLKIVAEEWVKYISVMNAFYMQNEDRNNNSTALENFHLRLRHLQSWRRRVMRSNQKIKFIIARLNAWNTQANSSNGRLLRELIMDYEDIDYRITDYGQKLESMIPMVTSLVQILDARHSITKATNVGRLTALALIFVPLNYVSSLFSMKDVNSPGGTHFWVYFVVAVPVTIMVLALAMPPSYWLMITSLCATIAREKSSQFRQR